MDSLSVTMMVECATIGDASEMTDLATMNLTRKRVLRAIRELGRGGDRVTYDAMGEYADCSAKTAQRAVRELITDGRLTQVGGGRGHGYVYEIRGKPS